MYETKMRERLGLTDSVPSGWIPPRILATRWDGLRNSLAYIAFTVRFYYHGALPSPIRGTCISYSASYRRVQLFQLCG